MTNTNDHDRPAPEPTEEELLDWLLPPSVRAELIPTHQDRLEAEKRRLDDELSDYQAEIDAQRFEGNPYDGTDQGDW